MTARTSETSDSTHSLVLVTDGDENEFRSQFSDTALTVCDETTLEQTLEADTYDGVIVTTPDPDSLERSLRTVRAHDRAMATVVAPPEGRGSEHLATVALREGATEYVPSTEAATRRERVLECVSTTWSTQIASITDVLTNRLPDEVFVLTADGTYLDVNVNPEAADLYTVSADELYGRTLHDAFPTQTADRLLDSIHQSLETDTIQSVEYEAETTDGRRRFEGRVIPIDRPVQGTRAVVWLARDITERVRRERALRRQRDNLETLNRINDVVHRVIRTLVEAPTRSAIEDAVCEHLVESPLYCGSWIGEPSGDGDVVFRTGSGDARLFLERVQAIETTTERPTARAIRTRETQTSNNLAGEAQLPAPLKDAVERHDITSAIIVPIVHGERVYGTLSVLACRSDAFSDEEQNAFRLLGETIGFAINAVDTRQLLLADAVSVLEFRIDGGTSFGFDLTEQYDCVSTLEWGGKTADGTTLHYVTITGADAATVESVARNHDSVEAYRVISDSDERVSLELQLTASAVGTLADYGATIRDLSVEDGVGQITAEVPRDANVRDLVDALQRIYENTELLARREVDRSVATASERRTHVRERLTDRQLMALRLAYYGGFFDWPRGSTGEEIADAMDISAPTMHQHLRKALDEVLSAFFEDVDDP